MADLRDKRVELTLQQLEELPTLPAVAVRVLQVMGDDHSSAADVVRLIGSDPALTARILQLTRRADRGVRDEVHSVDRAIVLLGFDAVRAAVLAVSVFQALGGPESGPSDAPSADAENNRRFSREGFWTHSLAVACCAELLAEAAPRELGLTAADAFLCGLLHDLGKLALDVALPKSYARVVEAAELLRGNIADLERTVIGVDHLIAGKRLAERWQLPAIVRDVAWLHGQPPEALPATVRAPIINLITLADLLVRQQHLGYSGNYAYSVSRDVLMKELGLSPAAVERVVGQLVARIEPRSSALGLGQTTSDALYRQALAQANRELSRVSSQLAAKSRKLNQRTEFFEALGQFQSGLRADATPHQVLCAVATTAAGLMGLESAVAFSLSPTQAYAEVVLCGADASAIEATLVELPAADAGTTADPATLRAHEAAGVPPPEPGYPVYTRESDAVLFGGVGATAGSLRPVPPAERNAPVQPAGDTLEWLTAALGPRLPHDRRYWICLTAEGACIGGVVWGAAAGEPDRLAPHAQELAAMAHAWALAVRMAQVRDEARTLSEELADANRRLHTAQDHVLRSRSLTTIAELAAGAAHEMNNPLAVISGRSQFLASLLSDEKHRQMARLIHEQADRLSDIITDMMAFAKPAPPVVRGCKMGHLLADAVKRAKTLCDPADRSIEATVGEIPEAAVDETQVASAIAEVLANAIQATPAGSGRITLHAGFDPWSDRVVVTVTDNGLGMDETTLKHAFDPFFSAKKAGRRRGLGLAKAIRWIEASGGTIRLESQVGVGTRVMILLPASRPSAASGGDPRRVGEPSAGESSPALKAPGGPAQNDAMNVAN
jgi:putative nucleotidyltransferase with HDIG domain